MRNIGFLMLAILLFGLAYYVYWIVAQENAVAGNLSAPASRGVRSGGGPEAGGIKQILREWQPYLSAASSLGGIASFLFQVRVWMRARN